MKKVRYKDENGVSRVVLLPDDIPDTQAYKGIPMQTPDVAGMNWEEIGLEIHNLLVERGLTDLDELSRNQQELSNAIVISIRPKVIDLFREFAKNNPKENKE